MTTVATRYHFIYASSNEMPLYACKGKCKYALLHDHCEDTGFLMELTSITEPLWKVANKRYPQAKV
jgi:hypothetical protein